MLHGLNSWRPWQKKKSCYKLRVLGILKLGFLVENIFNCLHMYHEVDLSHLLLHLWKSMESLPLIHDRGNWKHLTEVFKNLHHKIKISVCLKQTVLAWNNLTTEIRQEVNKEIHTFYKWDIEEIMVIKTKGGPWLHLVCWLFGIVFDISVRCFLDKYIQ